MARPFPALDRSNLECTAGEDRLEGNDAEALSMHEALKSLGTESWDGGRRGRFLGRRTVGGRRSASL